MMTNSNGNNDEPIDSKEDEVGQLLAIAYLRLMEDHTPTVTQTDVDTTQGILESTKNYPAG